MPRFVGRRQLWLRDRVPIGRVDDPRPLTAYDPDHPYFMAEYDLSDRG